MGVPQGTRRASRTRNRNELRCRRLQWNASRRAATRPIGTGRGEHADVSARATEKADHIMRPGIIIAVVAAVAVLIGGFVWYNNDRTEQARMDVQRNEQAVQDSREQDLAREEANDLARQDRVREEEDRARLEQDAATAEPAAAPADEAVGPVTEEAAVTDDAVADDDVIVVGDQITDGVIVVQSTSGEPTILSADAVATSTQLVDGTGTAAATDPARLLTPEEFDRDEVLTLINGSDLLTMEDRSTLRAMVDGVQANPEMIDATIASIRAALDLPPLN